MKYTVENTLLLGKPVKCYLNGVEIEDVIECDDESGYVIVAMKDGKGNLIIDGDGIATHRHVGAVRVEFKS